MRATPSGQLVSLPVGHLVPSSSIAAASGSLGTWRRSSQREGYRRLLVIPTMFRQPSTVAQLAISSTPPARLRRAARGSLRYPSVGSHHPPQSLDDLDTKLRPARVRPTLAPGRGGARGCAP